VKEDGEMKITNRRYQYIYLSGRMKINWCKSKTKQNESKSNWIGWWFYLIFFISFFDVRLRKTKERERKSFFFFAVCVVVKCRLIGMHFPLYSLIIDNSIIIIISMSQSNKKVLSIIMWMCRKVADNGVIKWQNEWNNDNDR
jgi:hypothetical protein